MRILLSLMVVVCGCASTLRLDTSGGEAWTLDKAVTGEARGCAEVVAEGPGGAVAVAPIDGRFELDVPLVYGENVVEVRCGRVRAAQRWDVRLSPAPHVPRRLDVPWEDAVVYGVVPYFFGDGRLPDVTARLDAIAELGVTAVWLSPVTAAPDDDYGYATLDHHALRPSFGTEEDLKELVAAAHDRGLAVILDLALNHTSDRHPWFVSAETDPWSPYAAFYDRDAAGEPTHYLDWHDLPNLDYGHPEVQAMALDALASWVDRFGVDGYRLDAIWGVHRRSPEFLPRIRAHLGPDVLLLAEASARDGVWAGHGFDVAYDWTGELGHWAWQAAFDEPERTASRLREVLLVETDIPILRFLDNNDTGTRFAARHGPARTRTAIALLMTVPGVPLVFTGSEVGADIDIYQEGPPLDWEDPDGLREAWTDWIALRRDHEALRRGSMTLLDTVDPVLAYLRGEGEDALLVALNVSDEPARLEPRDHALRDVRDGRIVDAGLPVELGPNEARVLARL